MAHVIKMTQITKSFAKKKVLDNVNFSVSESSIFGLLGPSGSGKTTIIKLLTGQLTADSGSASLFNTNAAQLTKAEYARIGMVLDESGIYKRLTVADNLTMFADIYGIGKQKITATLEKVDLLEALKKPVEKLSKGMLQRLILARAILHQPDVLFLDEPTSGLDPATVRGIHQLILEQQARGCTIFLTTHNMEEAASLCGRVALLNEGRIVEQGTPEDLCLKYNKSNCIHIQLKNGEHVELNNNQASADKIAALLKQEDIRTIHSTEPDLEAVFIELTGRKLA